MPKIFKKMGDEDTVSAKYQTEHEKKMAGHKIYRKEPSIPP